ncbi:uncharacterized protein MYCFIDRAFT_85212 [Pseudocercospora fijiensis CIRAD86]|uniref:F-box domain-containing protein n=1 Tax=Pseudocercospora fijiensis (strain CIRAD86) TaxID=383855 RepID=M3AUL6_PSEFD|nr:uncharacterized protein MYCFIDRAFT_85212 [Pseudocercospora fijiensis CIRAD86]EME80833.1 hypothetical protein MYCFIDRAFT_85212 [Pseudocercospora fijiensis CIRAD86]
MAQPAAHAVLHTVELLQAILLSLDTKTLLLSQRTCKTWQDVIADSILLQEALFFRPAPPPDHTDCKPQFDALASEVFQLRKLKPGFPHIKAKHRPKEYINPWITGSFRHMLITQPPAQVVWLHTRHGGVCVSGQTVNARDGEGVTIGDVLDKLEKLSGGKPNKTRGVITSVSVGEKVVVKPPFGW